MLNAPPLLTQKKKKNPNKTKQKKKAPGLAKSSKILTHLKHLLHLPYLQLEGEFHGPVDLDSSEYIETLCMRIKITPGYNIKMLFHTGKSIMCRLHPQTTSNSVNFKSGVQV